MARPGKLDDEKVRQIRSIYASAREYSEDVGPDDEGYQTAERLAETFGVSQPMIRRIVLGLSYASVDGPLDERRRATAKEVLDEKPPKSVRVTIQRPGGSAKSYVHPPGTTILIEPIFEDPDSYAESGLPLKGKAKATSTAPVASTGPGKLTYEEKRKNLLRKIRSNDTPRHKLSMYRNQLEELDMLHGN